MSAIANKVRAYVVPCLFALTLVVVGPSAAFAQEGDPVTITEIVSASDFTSIVSSIASAVSPIVKAAIGLSVGLFIVGFLYRILRKYIRQGA